MATEVLVSSKSSADEQVKSFASVLELRTQQTDVADVVLCAAVRATGDVDVDGIVEFDFRVEKLGQRDSVTFGVGRGVFAIAIASAGN